MDSTLLWYDLCLSKLMLWGFEINTYVKCVVNKIVEEKYCTILWYVDDKNISHIKDELCEETFPKLMNTFRD